MTTQTQTGGYSTKFASTARNDAWWLEPLWTGLGFLCFVIYTTWAMLQAGHYWHGSYLSPLYSPLLFVEPSVAGAAPVEHAWFGSWPSGWPEFLPPSPAILILIGPLSFRLTCYYYRKFYYRSYFASPPACGVTALPQKEYQGETRLFSFQNVHRYTLYIALFYIAILAYDAFLAFFRDGQFGAGVGTLVMVINVLLLSGYTLGCHALRHLVGGRLDCFSCPSGAERLTHKTWSGVSRLNARHMLWAWVSMIWVGFTDFYIRMVSMGVFHDFNTWGSS
jgi:hypothetical protein